MCTLRSRCDSSERASLPPPSRATTSERASYAQSGGRHERASVDTLSCSRAGERASECAQVGRRYERASVALLGRCERASEFLSVGRRARASLPLNSRAKCERASECDFAQSGERASVCLYQFASSRACAIYSERASLSSVPFSGASERVCVSLSACERASESQICSRASERARSFS